MAENVLSVRDLHICYETDHGVVNAVNGISFDIKKGETLGMVGESGAGKTTTALGIMGLVPDPPGKITKGSIVLDGEEITNKTAKEMQSIRGNIVSMIFQDPMTSLNPVLTVGEQVAEVIRLHQKLSRVDAELRAKEMLEKVGIPGQRHNEYPHQFSGGMKQRVIIAIALACNPHLLIADEPTTALDVTIQAQVLDMMRRLRKDFGTSMLLITHDLGVVAEMCDKVAITYAGEIMEYGTLQHIFKNPCHPYTKGLFGSIPSLDREVKRLSPIHGTLPDPMNLPENCSFYERCSAKTKQCEKNRAAMVEVEPGHFVKCHLVCGCHTDE